MNNTSNLKLKTHLHAIIRPHCNFDIRFLMYNLLGGTVILNLMFFIFNITVYDQIVTAADLVAGF